MNSEIISAMMHLAMLSTIGGDSFEEINWKYVEREYALVKDKKSMLSRSKRDWIVRTWENRR